jgi:uncharacterized membrane protein
MKAVPLLLVRVESTHYSFLSGVFIALGVNLYTGVFASDTVPRRWLIILMAAGLSAVSSVAWMLLSWTCDPIQKTASYAKPKGVDRDDTYRALVKSHQYRILLYFAIAVIAAGVAMAVLRYGY